MPPHVITRYTVYDNLTDFPVIVCGTAEECACVMETTTNVFYQLLLKQRRHIAENPRWYIVTERGCDW